MLRIMHKERSECIFYNRHKSSYRARAPRYKDRKTCKLVLFSSFIGAFAVTEMTCGIIFNSLVLLADALHMSSDIAALLVSIAANTVCC